MKKNYSVSNLLIDSDVTDNNYNIETTSVTCSNFEIPESVDDIIKIFADGDIVTICNDATMEAIEDIRTGKTTAAGSIPIELSI